MLEYFSSEQTRLEPENYLQEEPKLEYEQYEPERFYNPDPESRTPVFPAYGSGNQNMEFFGPKDYLSIVHLPPPVRILLNYWLCRDGFYIVLVPRYTSLCWLS